MENTLKGVEGDGKLGLGPFEKSVDDSFAHPAAHAGGFGGTEGNPYASGGHSSTTTSGQTGSSNPIGSQGVQAGQSSAHRVAEGKEQFGYDGQPSAGRDFGSGREAGGDHSQGSAQVLSSYQGDQSGSTTSTHHNTSGLSSAGGLASGLHSSSTGQSSGVQAGSTGGLHSGSNTSSNALTSSGNNTGADYSVGNTRHGISDISGGTTATREQRGLSGMQPEDVGGNDFAANTGHTFGQVTDTDRSKSSENWERQAGVDLAGGSGTLGSEHSHHKDSNRGVTGTATDKAYTDNSQNKAGLGAAGVLGAAGLAGAGTRDHGLSSSSHPTTDPVGHSSNLGHSSTTGTTGTGVSPSGTSSTTSGLHQSSHTGSNVGSGSTAAGLGAAGVGGAAAYGAGQHDSSNTASSATQSGGYQGLDNKIPDTGNANANKAMNVANDKLKERTGDDGFTNLAPEGQEPVAGLTGRAKLDPEDPKLETTSKSRSNKDAQGRELDSYGKPYDL